jgi:hypothetical protein
LRKTADPVEAGRLTGSWRSSKMTYNFDPERWYDNERAALKARGREQGWSAAELEAALEDLERRYEEMLRRLDGSYQIPK